LRETTSIETSCAEGRLRGLAETVQQPTLKVDIEVEGNLVPAAVAGHFTFPKPEGCAGARKYYTCAVDNPAPEPDTPTELIAVSLNRNDGFVLKSWTGNCAYFDANGTYLGMLPATVPEDPDDWVTGDTIYVKCLKANPTQMASAMTDMAVLAGASAEGAAETLLLPTVAFLKALVSKGLLLIEGGGALEKSKADLKTWGYQTKPLERPRAFEALKEIEDRTNVVFVFNGHGLDETGPQTFDGDAILIHEKDPDDEDDNDVWLHWRAVIDHVSDDESNYDFVYLNTCSCGSKYSMWQAAFRSDAFFGWYFPVRLTTMRTFDQYFWEEILELKNERKIRKAYESAVLRCQAQFMPDDVPVFKQKTAVDVEL